MRFWKLNNAICAVSLLASGLTSVHASSADPKLCGEACRQTFRTLKFADAPEGVFFSRQECMSRLYQTSLYLCWDAHCSKDVWEAESSLMNQTCQDIYDLHLAPHDIIDDITDEKRAQIIRFNATDPGRAHRYDVLMLPSQSYYDIWIRTLVSPLILTVIFLRNPINMDPGRPRLHMGLSLLLRLGYGDFLGCGHCSGYREPNTYTTVYRARLWKAMA
jgi:hypothetical protein